MTADEIQSSADAATRVAAIQREWGGVTERVLRDAGVVRASLMTLGCCLAVGATSWQGYTTLKAEAQALALRFGLPAPDLPLAARVSRQELETYLHVFIQLLHQPSESTTWIELLTAYDDAQRNNNE